MDNQPTLARLVLQNHGQRVLSSCENCRDLGGYPTPNGMTQFGRFLRSGNTGGISAGDLEQLRNMNLQRVVDLRSTSEVEEHPDALTYLRGIRYLNAPLHDTNLHDPQLAPVNSDDELMDFLANGYLKMLGNHRAIRRIFRFFSHAQKGSCVLFHCAAGMDRTGVVSMLLLGLAQVDRQVIVADYGYSFGPSADVQRVALGADTTGVDESLVTLCQLMGTVYDRVVQAYGSVEDYLLECGCSRPALERVRRHLVEP
ncbi:MAG: tyrosine-protein phosphatase [Atopobiaceae bacterium]